MMLFLAQRAQSTKCEVGTFVFFGPKKSCNFDIVLCEIGGLFSELHRLMEKVYRIPNDLTSYTVKNHISIFFSEIRLHQFFIVHSYIRGQEIKVFQ